MSTTSSVVHESLAILDKQIVDMTEALNALKRRRNALLPVNRLPDELLEEIIVTAHTLEVSEHQNTVPKTLPTLLLVCSRWHIVAQSSRQTWALVDLAYRDITCMSAQSGDYPRTLWAGGLHNKISDTSRAALKALAPLVQTILLDYSKGVLAVTRASLVRCLCEASFINLTRAEIILNMPAHLGGTTFLPMPRLRLLILHGVHPSYLNPWILPELTHLTLSNVMRKEDSTPFMLQIAAGCTALKALVLRSVGNQVTIGPRLRFPHLEDLAVTSAHPKQHHAWLNCIDVPASCSFDFSVCADKMDCVWPAAPFASLLEQHKPAITKSCFDIYPTGITFYKFEGSQDYQTVRLARDFSKPWQCWGDVASVARQMWQNMPLESLRYAWVDMPSCGDMEVSTAEKKTGTNPDLVTVIVNQDSPESGEDEAINWEVLKVVDLLLDAVPEDCRQSVL